MGAEAYYNTLGQDPSAALLLNDHLVSDRAREQYKAGRRARREALEILARAGELSVCVRASGCLCMMDLEHKTAAPVVESPLLSSEPI
jgi:hypothetical protein